jgi:hypothetical protein
MHPHGLLPLGAILNGLTWDAWKLLVFFWDLWGIPIFRESQIHKNSRAEAGGGLKGITASGAELPEPENGGKLLHQRWFRHVFFRQW